MRRLVILLVSGGLLVSCVGCGLKQVRSKTKFGASFRHKEKNNTDSTQWTMQQGLSFSWKHGLRTGITYRRRDIDDGNGNSDNAVYVDVSFPVWKKPKKPDKTAKRLKKLEKRLARLEAEIVTLRAGSVVTPGDD